MGGAHDILTVAVSPTSMLGIEDISDEEEDDDAALVCRVCREGYRSRPRELMGVYCFCKRVECAPAATNSLVNSTNTTANTTGYATVSHFNAIHFACHAAARRADIALRTPKREWEGASLRNSETLCNNLLPVFAGRVGDASFARAAGAWWENVAAAVGKTEPASARLRLALADVSMLLGRFATGANGSFSADCHGGGRESNMRVVPFVLQLAAHELARDPNSTSSGSASSSRSQTNAAVHLIEADDDDDDDVNIVISGVRRLNLRNAAAARSALEKLMLGDFVGSAASPAFPAALALSVLITPLDDWTARRRDALRAAVAHARREGSRCVDGACGVGAARPEVHERHDESPHDDFGRAKPILIYVGLVDKLQRWLKPSGGSSPLRPTPSAPVPVGGGGGMGSQSSSLAQLAAEAEDAIAAAAAALDAAEALESGSADAAAASVLTDVRERLRDLPAMSEWSKETLEWLEDVETSEDFLELFDSMELLGDVLTDGTSSADEFVEEASGLR